MRGSGALGPFGCARPAGLVAKCPAGRGGVVDASAFRGGVSRRQRFFASPGRASLARRRAQCDLEYCEGSTPLASGHCRPVPLAKRRACRRVRRRAPRRRRFGCRALADECTCWRPAACLAGDVPGRSGSPRHGRSGATGYLGPARRGSAPAARGFGPPRYGRASGDVERGSGIGSDGASATRADARESLAADRPLARGRGKGSGLAPHTGPGAARSRRCGHRGSRPRRSARARGWFPAPRGLSAGARSFPLRGALLDPRMGRHGRSNARQQGAPLHRPSAPARREGATGLGPRARTLLHRHGHPGRRRQGVPFRPVGASARCPREGGVSRSLGGFGRPVRGSGEEQR